MFLLEWLRAGITYWLLLALALFGVSVVTGGCSVMDTGPFTAGKIMGGVQVIATQLVSKMDIKEMTAGANGRISNPEFQFEGFVGPGWYWKANLRMIGADASFDVNAAGTGAGQDDFSMIWEAWQGAGAPGTFTEWVAGVAETIRGTPTTQPAG